MQSHYDRVYIFFLKYSQQINGLMQEIFNSIANTLELCLSRTNPSSLGVFLSDEVWCLHSSPVGLCYNKIQLNLKLYNIHSGRSIAFVMTKVTGVHITTTVVVVICTPVNLVIMNALLLQLHSKNEKFGNAIIVPMRPSTTTQLD